MKDRQRHLFTSDWHFGHKNIIQYSNRQFPNVEVMNEILIQYWNSVVHKNDIVWHLGDFAFLSKANTLEILKQLNGNIHIIFGNHDKSLRQISKDERACKAINRVKFFGDYYELNQNKKKFVLCHYPFECWNHNSYHVHGHIHNSSHINKKPFRVNVNIDADNQWNIIRENPKRLFKTESQIINPTPF